MPKRNATITAVGHYVPDRILSNADLEKMVDTNDEWIRTRTGISERRILDSGATSDLGAGALKAALRNRGIPATELDTIIVATVTPDMFFPSTACLVQHKVGATNAWGFDLSAACSGFVFALTTAAKLVESGMSTRVAVVGADKMSSITDYTDRNTCILFGDAGMLGGGSLNPPTHETVDKKMHYLFQDGKAVFKVAVVGMADVSAEIMERNRLTGADVDWLVPHQANLRIIDATAERMGLDRSKVMINIDRYGNTTAATIPLCLSEWWQSGKLRKGHRLVMSSFGAGFTWGAVLAQWTVDNAPGA